MWRLGTKINIELQFLAKVFRFHMKSAGFHEIRMKSGGFQVKSGGFHEIRWISGEIHPNLIKSEEFLLKHQKSFCSNI